jgi:lipopolysaccharide biosynthesis protein
MLGRFLIKLANLLRFLFPSPKQYYYIWLVKRCDMYDRQFYISTNPGLNPLFRLFPERHYVVFGEIANLRPNPDFSPEAYVRHNHDLGLLTSRPFYHYIKYGREEGRITKDITTGKDSVLNVASAIRVRPNAETAKDYAVQLHMFYHDLWPTFKAKLDSIDIEFDLFITITDLGSETDELITVIEQDYPNAFIARMPNQGRDIFPFVHVVNAGLLAPYKAVCKIHTKKSPHRMDGSKWRDHLIQGVLPGVGTAKLAEAFVNDTEAAFLVADGQHFTGEKWWGSNKQTTAHLLRRVEVDCDVDDLSFPAGSIYWIKPVMLSMIKGFQLDQHIFEPEIGQVDGTLAHAFERAIGYLAQNAGQKVRQTSEFLQAAPSACKTKKPQFTSAFYLPQFHPTPENDAWWGTGFTEWSSTVKAKPAFPGHAQPQLPADLGFYDLRLPNTMGQQWEMAKDAGINAFCVYHYWFSGRRVLERPMDNLLDAPDIPFNFYLCWANESWRRNWDGLSGEILLDQQYEEGFEAALASDTARYMKDPRYQRPDGHRPRFVIYRPDDMPNPSASVERLRAEWHKLGVGDVELGAVLFHIEGENPVEHSLFDFWIEMPPHGLVTTDDYLFGGLNGNQLGMAPATGFNGLIYDYEAVAKNSISKDYLATLPDNVIAGIMPSWDNTARRGVSGHIAYGANPAQFDKWLGKLLDQRLDTSYRQELFINAWNELAEKAMLEPSEQYGAAYLERLKDRL